MTRLAHQYGSYSKADLPCALVSAVGNTVLFSYQLWIAPLISKASVMLRDL